MQLLFVLVDLLDAGAIRVVDPRINPVCHLHLRIFNMRPTTLTAEAEYNKFKHDFL